MEGGKFCIIRNAKIQLHVQKQKFVAVDVDYQGQPKYLLLKYKDDSGKSKCSIGEKDCKHFIPEIFGLNVDSNKEDYAKVINTLQQ